MWPLDQSCSSSIKAYENDDLNLDRDFYRCVLDLSCCNRLVTKLAINILGWLPKFPLNQDKYQLANSFGTFFRNSYQSNKTHQDLWHLLITQGEGSLLKDIVLPSAEVCSILLTPAETRIMPVILPLNFILFLSVSLSPCLIILYIFYRLATQHG